MILELTNPEVELAALDAESRSCARPRPRCRAQGAAREPAPDQRADLARIESEYRAGAAAGRRRRRRSRSRGWSSDARARQLSSVAAEELATRRDRRAEAPVDRGRRDPRRSSPRSRPRSSSGARSPRCAGASSSALQVRAGLDGVLQEVPVEVGQRVTPGTNLARVAQPEQLKAVAADPGDAGPRRPDRPAGLDRHAQRRRRRPRRRASTRPCRTGPSRSTWPSTGDAAAGRPARPDASTARSRSSGWPNVAVRRAGRRCGQPRATVGLFRLGRRARTRRSACRSSSAGRRSTRSRCARGLAAGDQVILSDMSAWDAHDRIRLK